jgi:hypothetical protein
MFKGILKSLFLIALLLVVESCVQKDSVGKRTSLGRSINITSASLVNNQLIVKGSDFSRVNKVQIKSSTTTYNFTVESVSTNQIVANAMSAINFTADTMLDLVVSSAQSAATFPITFSIANNSITSAMLTSMGASAGQMLKFNGTTWVPFSPTSSQTYLGTWDANDFPTFPTATATGDYYIVNVAAGPYNVGDWIIFNGITFDQIVNTSGVVSLFGRTGIVTANEADYVLDKMGDVDLTTITPLANDVLKFNGTKWVPGTVSVSGGTVTNVTGTLPLSVANASTNPTISISQATTSANGYLSSTDWNTFNNKQSSIAAGTFSQYYRGDKTWQTLDTFVVPENTNLYFTNARTLGVPLTGFSTFTGAVAATDTVLAAFGKVQGQLNAVNSVSNNYLIKNSSDSITGLVNVGTTGLLQLNYVPVGLNDATNKSYVDSAVGNKVSKSGDTLSGVLTLDNDLKIKGGSSYVTVKGHLTSANYNFILPQTAGTVGNVLSTDGSGNLAWVSQPTTATPSGAASGDLTGSYPNPTISNANLIALKAYNTNGIIVQAASNSFVGRSIAGTANRIIVSNGSGVTGNPQIDIDNSLLPSPGTAGLLLKSTGFNTSAWTMLSGSDVTSALGFTPLNKNGDTMSTGIFDFNGSAFLRVPTPVGINDAANKSYVDSFGQWSKSGSDIYRASGNVGIGTSVPSKMLEVNGDALISGLMIGKGGGAQAYNTAIGNFALKNNTAGASNTATGYNALYTNTTSSYNTANGFYSLRVNTGAQNSALGAETLYSNTTGYNNTAIGFDSLYASTTGNNNIAIGFNSGKAITTGSGNVVIGSNDGNSLGNSDGNILIADGFGNERIKVDPTGKVAFGIPNPATNLHIKSTVSFSAPQPFKNTIMIESEGTDVSRYGALVYSSTEAPVYTGYRALGSRAAPLPVTSGTALNQFSAYGYDGTSYGFSAAMQIMSTELWNPAAHGTAMTFATTANGSNTLVERMRVDHNGNIGIGTSTPGFTLHVNGSIAGTSPYNNVSDKRLKKNIHQIPNALENILQLRGVFYDWNKEVNPEFKLGDRQELGVIAQEVEKVYPQAVSLDKKSGFRNVAYSMLIAPIIEAVKELYNKFLGHEKQLREIASTQVQITSEMQALKAENAKLKSKVKEFDGIKAYLCKKDPTALICK